MNMKEYIQALETYVASRKLNLEDGESILSLLYEAYSDANRMPQLTEQLLPHLVFKRL